jgi:hypothetical protein
MKLLFALLLVEMNGSFQLHARFPFRFRRLKAVPFVFLGILSTASFYLVSLCPLSPECCAPEIHLPRPISRNFRRGGQGVRNSSAVFEKTGLRQVTSLSTFTSSILSTNPATHSLSAPANPRNFSIAPFSPAHSTSSSLVKIPFSGAPRIGTYSR